MLFRCKYVWVVVSIILCNHLWAGIVISENRKSFVYDDVDPPITWCLDYSLSEDKL